MKRSRTIARPSRSNRITRRRITILAWLSGCAAGWTKRPGSIGKPLRSSPTTPTLTATWPMCWPLKASWMKPSPSTGKRWNWCPSPPKPISDSARRCKPNTNLRQRTWSIKKLWNWNPGTCQRTSVWLGCWRPVRRHPFATVPRRWHWHNRRCNFPAASLRRFLTHWQRLMPRPAVSRRRWPRRKRRSSSQPQPGQKNQPGKTGNGLSSIGPASPSMNPRRQRHHFSKRPHTARNRDLKSKTRPASPFSLARLIEDRVGGQFSWQGRPAGRPRPCIGLRRASTRQGSAALCQRKNQTDPLPEGGLNCGVGCLSRQCTEDSIRHGKFPLPRDLSPQRLSDYNTAVSRQNFSGRLSMKPWARLAIPGALIVLFVFLAYLPALRGGFIWDDDVYVTNNPLLTAPDGLRRIWFSMDSPSQYFPLTYTVFRIEHSLWGLNPTGYHSVNILLHAINALLVWLLLKRLSVPGAWLAAALFGLHPVQVESVAWITELKSVLSLFFILLTLGCWIEFIGDRSRRFWYWLALVFYALALFSKTTACTLPAALLLILWLKGRPIDWRRLAQVVPFLAMGLGMGLLTIWWERFRHGTQGKLFSMGLLERILVASHALWFYAGKLFWPVNLTFSYPRWAIEPAHPSAYGWLLLGIGSGAAIYFTRRFVGRSVEVAALFYVATLSPLLGFVM